MLANSSLGASFYLYYPAQAAVCSLRPIILVRTGWALRLHIEVHWQPYLGVAVQITGCA